MAINHYFKSYVMLIIAILSLSNTLRAADSITPEEASRYIGETMEVCGVVASATYAENERGQPTFLNLNRSFPNHIFTAVIWGSNRTKFSYRPETMLGKEICVRGRIEEHRGKPQIEVYQPTQIQPFA